MDVFVATAIVSGMCEEANEDERLEAWQVLVDTQVVWTMPGSFGRMAANLIERGLITN